MQIQLNTPIHKILIIRMSSIGDILLTTPLLRQLRALYPAAEIDFLVRKEYAQLLQANPHLSRLLTLDVHAGGALKALKKQIRHHGYDVILDLHRNLRSGYLCAFWNRPPVLKIRKNQLSRFLLVHFKLNLYRRGGDRPLHVAEKYLRAAVPLGIDPRDLALEMHLPRAVEESGKSRWLALAAQGYGIVMAPGARHFTKRWPPAYYAELIQQIYKSTGRRTVLVGGPDEREIITEIRRLAGEEITLSLAGEVSLPETFALICHAPCFVSNDSGLMHAAAAGGVPQVALFGSTTEELGFFPLNPAAQVLQNPQLSCRPCSHIGRAACPKGHFRCMKEIRPEEVVEVILKKLG